MKTLEKVTEDIKSVRVQGAKEIAIYALKFLKEFCKKNGFGLKFEVASKVLEDTRPTAVVLHNCLEIVKKEKKVKTFDRLIGQLNNATKKIARNGSKLIKKNYRIMTHCHSGEALAVIKQSWLEKKNISVFATITEPLEQGVKTAKELASLKIPVTLILDSAAGFFMKDVDCVLVGADAIRTNSKELVNKTGTLLLALAAKEFKKPFYVAASTLKIDTRKKFVIEERPAREIYRELANSRSVRGMKIRNPAFDRVPIKFVAKIVTEKGILSSKSILRMRR